MKSITDTMKIAERTRRYLATDEVLRRDWRRHLFEPCWPSEAREIAIRHQLDAVLGVAAAAAWAARWRAGEFKRSRARWTAYATSRT